MNVETIRQREHSFERYSFKEHAAGHWSLEHIHAQSAEGITTEQGQWATWLRLHRQALEALDDVDDGAQAEPSSTGSTRCSPARRSRKADFQDLEHEFIKLLSRE